MNNQEFSDQFDVLYNNITSNQAPGLNEYEKSVFLTKAQEEIVKNYFSPKGNPKQDGFDDSPKRQADFSNIISTSKLTLAPTYASSNKFDQRSLAFESPSDMFICLNEQLMDGDTPLTVVPVSYSEYDRLMAKPYKYPPKYQAWRLTTQRIITGADNILPFDGFVSNPSIADTGTVSEPDAILWDTYRKEFLARVGGEGTIPQFYLYWATDENYKSDKFSEWTYESAETGQLYRYNGVDLISASGVISISEIIGRFNSTPSYRVRYIRRPKPIVLVNLSGIQNDLTIQGETGPVTSELSEELHEEILQRAVELAKVAWDGNVQTVTQAGQRSE